MKSIAVVAFLAAAGQFPQWQLLGMSATRSQWSLAIPSIGETVIDVKHTVAIGDQVALAVRLQPCAIEEMVLAGVDDTGMLVATRRLGTTALDP